MAVQPIILSTGLAVSLFIQHTATPIAGAWFFIVMCACGSWAYKENHEDWDGIHYAAFLWLMYIFVHGFIIKPKFGGMIYMSVFSVTPFIFLCLPKKHLQLCIQLCGVILAVYAGALVMTYIETGYRAAWPLLNANNAAAIINFGLIPAVVLFSQRRDLETGALAFIFTCGMLATQSKGGIIAALISLSLYYWVTNPKCRLYLIGIVTAGISAIVFLIRPGFHNIKTRLEIWDTSLQLLQVDELFGTGWGTFGGYYKIIRTESKTAGMFAHNDLLQILIEGGAIGLLIFSGVIGYIAYKTTKANLLPACVMLAILIHSQISFHFYIASVNILMGAALSYWYHTGKEPKSHE